MSALKIIRGDTLRLDVEMTDDVTNLPINITGKKLFFTVKYNITDPDESAAILEVHTFPVSTDSTNGKGTMIVSSDVTALLIPTTESSPAWYDYQLVDDTTTPVTVETLKYGQCKIISDVTRSTT